MLIRLVMAVILICCASAAMAMLRHGSGAISVATTAYTNETASANYTDEAASVNYCTETGSPC